MSIYIKDPATNVAVRKLAELRDVTLTEAIRDAVEKALREERRKTTATKTRRDCTGLAEIPADRA